jgi:hypothetical protein
MSHTMDKTPEDVEKRFAELDLEYKERFHISNKNEAPQDGDEALNDGFATSANTNTQNKGKGKARRDSKGDFVSPPHTHHGSDSDMDDKDGGDHILSDRDPTAINQSAINEAVIDQVADFFENPVGMEDVVDDMEYLVAMFGGPENGGGALQNSDDHIIADGASYDENDTSQEDGYTAAASDIRFSVDFVIGNHDTNGTTPEQEHIDRVLTSHRAGSSARYSA